MASAIFVDFQLFYFLIRTMPVIISPLLCIFCKLKYFVMKETSFMDKWRIWYKRDGLFLLLKKRSFPTNNFLILDY
jgi:hypothetical protein